METHDPDRRVEEARASLLARMEELGRRLQDARDKLDVRAHIAAHPQLAVGVAFALGALLGIPGGGKRKRKDDSLDAEDVKSGLVGAAVATLGSLAFSVVRSLAIHHLSTTARTWWDERQGVEAGASRTRDVEAFLEH